MICRFITYQDALLVRVRLVDGLGANILRISPVNMIVIRKIDIFTFIPHTCFEKVFSRHEKLGFILERGKGAEVSEHSRSAIPRGFRLKI